MKVSAIHCVGSLNDTISIQPSTGSIAIQLNKYCRPAKGQPSKERADLGFGGVDVKTRGAQLRIYSWRLEKPRVIFMIYFSTVATGIKYDTGNNTSLRRVCR